MTTTCVTFWLLMLVGTMNGHILRGCQHCVHMRMEIFNMPILYKSLIESTLSRLQLADQNCVDGTAHIEACIPHSWSDMWVGKCQAITMTITARGLGTIFPESIMVTSLTVRSCLQVEAGLEDGCTRLEATGIDFLQSIHEMTGSFKQQWNNITIDGELCHTAPTGVSYWK